MASIQRSPHQRIEVNAYLQQQQQLSDVDQEWWTCFEELYNKRLWHQLTIKVYEFIKTHQNEGLIALYNNFIIDFENKINSLTLIEMISYVVKQMAFDEKITFITKMKEKVKSNNQAEILCNIFLGQLRLSNGDMSEVKKILDETNVMMDEESGITAVHSRFYLLSSDYHQKMGNHCEYYRDALRYLGCAKLDDEDHTTKANRAFTLSLAALLGESIFNFGELLQHPIIESLKGDPREYIIELLYAFNSGDLAKYESLKSKWLTQPDLAHNEIPLRQKISLLSLMEMTFNSSNGVLTFEKIAKQTHLSINDVELLVMKALSLGLVKGTIDEVDAKVNLNWVQPRVLDKKQISMMRSKLDNWCRDVNAMEKLLEQKAHDIIN